MIELHKIFEIFLQSLGDKDELREFYKGLLEYIKFRFITIFNKKYKHKELLEIVKNEGDQLKYIPKRLMDYNLCLEAIKNDSHALCFVPKKFKDYNLCLITIKKNGYALEYIPEKFKDFKMCLTAVKQNNRVLKKIPEKYKQLIKMELNL